MKKFSVGTPSWKKALILCAIFVFMSIVSVFVVAVLMLLGVSALIGAAFGTIVMFGVTAWLYALWFEEKNFLKNVLVSKFSFKWLLFAILVLLFSLPIISTISVETQDEEMKLMVTDLTGWGLTKLIFVIALLPAVCEELFFRGLLQNLFIRKTKSVLASLIIVSAIFSAVHADLPNFMARFVMGLLLGMLYQYSGKLWTSMAFHFLNNAIAATLLWCEVKGVVLGDIEDFPLYIIIISVLFIVGFVVLNEAKNKRSIRNNFKELEN